MFGGTRYFLAVGAAGAPIEVRLGRDPRTLDITIDPVARLGVDARLTLRGTSACSSPEGLGSLDAEALQANGQPRIAGAGSTGFDCSLGTTSWSIALEPAGARLFHGGRVRVTVSGRYCMITACTVRRVSATVIVRH